MNDHDRLIQLMQRLDACDHRIVPPWQRPIVEVARAALEAEIVELSRRLRRNDYWHAPAKAATRVC